MLHSISGQDICFTNRVQPREKRKDFSSVGSDRIDLGHGRVAITSIQRFHHGHPFRHFAKCWKSFGFVVKYSIEPAIVFKVDEELGASRIFTTSGKAQPALDITFDNGFVRYFELIPFQGPGGIDIAELCHEIGYNAVEE